MMGIGWEFISQVVAGLLLGWLVDWGFSTKPWGILCGLGAGLVVGMWSFLRSALRLNASLPAVRKPPQGWKTIPDREDEEDSDDSGRDGSAPR